MTYFQWVVSILIKKPYPSPQKSRCSSLVTLPQLPSLHYPDFSQQRLVLSILHFILGLTHFFLKARYFSISAYFCLCGYWNLFCNYLSLLLQIRSNHRQYIHIGHCCFFNEALFMQTDTGWICPMATDCQPLLKIMLDNMFVRSTQQCMGAGSHWLRGLIVHISSPTLCLMTSCWQLEVVHGEVFTSWKLENATNHDFFSPYFLLNVTELGLSGNSVDVSLPLFLHL